jgi:hypothetical protein
MNIYMSLVLGSVTFHHMSFTTLSHTSFSHSISPKANVHFFLVHGHEVTILLKIRGFILNVCLKITYILVLLFYWNSRTWNTFLHKFASFWVSLSMLIKQYFKCMTSPQSLPTGRLRSVKWPALKLNDYHVCAKSAEPAYVCA